MKGINNIKIMHTLFSKMIGLRFHEKITDTAYVFPFDKPIRVSLDMFFVHFSIDVIFLDKDKKIIELKENFKPYSFYRTKNKITYVIEVPKDYIKKNQLKIGQNIEF